MRKIEHKGEDCLAVRFTFNKKLIEILEKTRNREKAYDRELKIHYFPIMSKLFSQVLNLLEGKNFEVEESIQLVYKELPQMNNNKKDRAWNIRIKISIFQVKQLTLWFKI